MLQFSRIKFFYAVVCFVLPALLLFSGCEKSESEMNSQFDMSFKSWLDFKQKNENNYEYTTQGANRNNYAWTTRIVVEDGVVVKRSFEYTKFAGVDKPSGGWGENSISQILNRLNMTEKEYQTQYKYAITEELSWEENGEEVGKTLNTPATKPWNLDQMYEWARLLIKDSKPGKQIYFEVDSRLLIKSCGFVLQGCQDDCFEGIVFKEIKSTNS